jgi:hypothetical protein
VAFISKFIGAALIFHGVNGMKDANPALIHFVMILGAVLLTRAVIRG